MIESIYEIPDTQWSALHLVGVDLETTGLDVRRDRIVTAAAVHITENGAPVEEAAMLTHPGIPIPEEASKVHRITDDQALRKGRPYEEVYAKLRATITHAWQNGHAVVVYNAPYDLSIIHHEGLRLGYPPLDVGFVIDPLVIDRQMTRKSGSDRSRRLKPTAVEHRVRADIEHDAIEDVLTTLRICWRMKRHPAVGLWSARKLWVMQPRWYRQRGEELREYFESKGNSERAATVGIEWPVER